MSSQSVCPTEKFSSRSPGAAVSPNKIICIRATNYLTNSSAYRAIKWPLARPPSSPMLSLLSSPPFSSLAPPFLPSSRRCLDTLWRHPHRRTSLSLSLSQERGTYTRIYTSLPRVARFFTFGSSGAIERSPPRFEFNKEPFPSRVIYNPARKLFLIISSRNLGAIGRTRISSPPRLLFFFFEVFVAIKLRTRKVMRERSVNFRREMDF